MIEEKFRLLMPSNIITDKMDQIIDAFVSYYGEDRREEITNKFKSILILKFCNTQNLSHIIDNIKTSLFKEIYGIDEKEYIYLGCDDLISFLENEEFNLYSFLYLNSDVKTYIFGNKDISNEEIYKGFHEGKYPQLEEFIKRYKSLKVRLAPYEELLKKEQDKEKKIEEKYFKILVNEFKDLFSAEELEDFNTTGFSRSKINEFLGIGIDTLGHAFDDEHEKRLNNPESLDWEIESIKRDRVSLLKEYIKLSDLKFKLNAPSYEDYLNNSEAKALIDKFRVICERITKRKKELYDLMNLETIESLEDYKTLRSEINKKGWVNKNDILGPFVYNSPVSCYEENYILTESGYVLSPLILINSGGSSLDCTIIHELNHALEQQTLSVNEKGSVSVTGWDESTIEFKDHQEHNEMQYKGITRGHELLSEYVNDRIAQEITDVMHEKGNYIFSSQRDKSTSSYLIVALLVEEFFREFKDVIIKSRSHNNINYLFECVGQENFEELNSLVNEFYSSFGMSLGAGSVVADYYKKVENEKTIHLGQLIERKNEIMQRMREQMKSKEM